MNKTQSLYRKAKTLIPGGTQLLSKRPELHLPGFWPAYYSKASGCEVWDLDGRKYIDMSYMGIGSCLLGYADPDVNRAVNKAVACASMTTLNPPEEVELAELLVKVHPWADMARFARTGGEAMSLAVRIARAKTGKDTVLFCGYHGWHDWYLSSNLGDRKSLDGHLLPGLNPFGVPRSLKGTSFPFAFNDTEAFMKLIALHGSKTGAVVLESIRNAPPTPEFIRAIRSVTKKRGIVLIADEITSGWRMNFGGAHLLFGLKPDIAVFAKGLSNGFPMAAVIGRRDVMTVAQDSFISSTYWTDRIGPTAALATLAKLNKLRAWDHMAKAGKAIKKAWAEAASSAGVPIELGGIDQLAHFSFEHTDPLALKTLFTQEMLAQGILATTAYYASYAHKDKHIVAYEKAARKAFVKIRKAIDSGDPRDSLKGPVCHSGFKRLT